MEPQPSPPIDVNAIAAEVIKSALLETADTAVELSRQAYRDFKVRLGTAFRAYLERELSVRSRVKTILYRHSSQYIYDFYVPQDLTQGSTRVLQNVTASLLFERSLRTVITGTGGSGKSFLQRHLFIGSAADADRIPILIELRQLNSADLTVRGLLYRELDLRNVKIDPPAFERELGRGHFALLLDGLDELVAERRDQLSREIQELSVEYPDVAIVVTSRPDERFVGWHGFEQFVVAPLTKQKTMRLIRCLNYDLATKGRFAEAVDRSLWSSHQSFLSSPLLATIMLMNFEQNATVPSKMHLFYAQVFETLWNKHDALKDGYVRSLESCLDKDMFMKVLEAFAFKTHWNSQSIMNDGEAHDALKSARLLTGATFDQNLFLSDLIKAVCILNQDGIVYSFTHRSFQEYYAARFILSLSESQRAKLYSQLVRNWSADQVLTLMWEMDRRLVEREVIQPALSKLGKAVSGLNKSARLKVFVSSWCSSVRPMKALVDTKVLPEFAEVFNFVIKRYRPTAWDGLTQNRLGTHDSEWLARLRTAMGVSSAETALRVESHDLTDATLAVLSEKLIFSDEALQFFLSVLKDIEEDIQREGASLDDLLR